MSMNAWMKRLAPVCFLALLAGGSSALAAPTAGQTIELHPGWNAVFLEVQPADNTTTGVFESLPVSSVWKWTPKTKSGEFVQNMSETLYNDSSWQVYFPTNRHAAMFNSLYRVYANTAYLIKLAGTNAVTWTLTGEPAVPRYTWKPNVFHLTGFLLNPAGPQPAVTGFFAPSPQLAGQAVYRLDQEGTWGLVPQPGPEVLSAGEALWVYATGETDYMGPVSVKTGDGSGLDYADIAVEKKVKIANLSPTHVTVRIRDASGSGGPLAYWTMAGDEASWIPLPDPLAISLGAGESYTLRLAVRREQFSSEVFETVIEIASDSGTRVRLPLSAKKNASL